MIRSSYNQHKHRASDGFTIVELLIVIVIIGILAAITLVAYSGIQQRAKESALKSDLALVSKKMAADNALNGSYALTQAAVDGGKGLPASSGTSYQFQSTGSSYCITGTNGNLSFKVSDTATVATQGGCAGDGVGGVPAVTNYAADPNAAGASTSGFGSAGSSPIATTTTIASDRSHSGATSLKKFVTGASGYTAAMAMTPAADSLRVNVGEKVQWSFWVYSTVAGTPTVYWQGTKVSDGTYTGGSSGTVSIPANTWTKVTGTHAPTMDVYVRNAGLYNLTVVANDTVWFDEFMVTKGETLPNYADGYSPNWLWNGTANNATSTGPAQ